MYAQLALIGVMLLLTFSAFVGGAITHCAMAMIKESKSPVPLDLSSLGPLGPADGPEEVTSTTPGD